MFSIRDLEKGTYIVLDGEPYEVTDRFFRSKQQREATAVVTVKNLINGKVLEKTFQAAAVIEEAKLEESTAQYQYRENDDFYFMDEQSYEQFAINKETLRETAFYLTEGIIVKIKSFQGKPITVALPAEVKLKVTQAPPDIKGDTESGGSKTVTLETGLQISVPLHIKEGDILRIKTKTGKYDGKE